MMVLCGLTGFWLLVSPLVPYTFDIAHPQGLIAFVALQGLVTVLLSALGITLNHLAARGARVTPYALRMALRRNRRR
jgi:hypothetical protein